jgi:hypothetical protein
VAKDGDGQIHGPTDPVSNVEKEYLQPAGGKPPLRATIHHHYKPGTNQKEATTTMMLEGKYYTGTTTFDTNRVATFSVKDVTEAPKSDIGARMENK